MEALFLKLVNMSITASWLVLAIIAVRLVFKKAPKWILCLLWGLVAFRLVCPFSIESGLSLIPDAEPLSQESAYTPETGKQAHGDILDSEGNVIVERNLAAKGDILDSEGNVIVEVEDGHRTYPEEEQAHGWMYFLSRIWLAGFAVMLAYTAVSYYLLRQKVSTAIPLVKGIKQSEYVDSPFVLGIIPPVIYLPFDMSEADCAYVIAHEKAHIRRRDHWWKPFGFLLLSIYWFNPVLWVAYILLCRDIEAACDEKVIKDMEKDERRAYSTALLNCSIHRRRIAACPLAFGETGVKTRVKAVMNYKKPAFWVILIAIMVSAIIAICFMTNPKNSDSESWESEIDTQVYFDRTMAYIQFDYAEDLEYQISEEYTLEMQEGGKWKELAKLSENLASNEVVAVTSEETDFEAWTILEWEETYGRLSDGSYRIKKDITKITSADEVETKPLYVAFTIGGTAEQYITYTLEDITLTGANLYEHETIDDSADLVYSEEGFWLEILQDGQWVYMEPTGDVKSFLPQEKYYIHELHYPSSHIELDWSDLYGELPDGIYRIAREIAHTGISDLRLGTAYAEFSISNNVYVWFDFDADDLVDRHLKDDTVDLFGMEGTALSRDNTYSEIRLIHAEGMIPVISTDLMIRSAYLTDLTGDGIAEVCASVQTDTGMVIQVYDPSEEKLYELAGDDGSYFLAKKANRLCVLRKDIYWVTLDYGILGFSNELLGVKKLEMQEIDSSLEVLTKRISSVEVINRRVVSLSRPQEIEKMIGLLENLKQQVKPAPGNVLQKAQENMFNSVLITIHNELGEKSVYFSEDYRLVWEYGSNEGFEIADPEPLKSYVDSLTNGVLQQETSGSAFATVDVPWDWCKYVNSASIESAKAHVCLYTYRDGNSFGSSSTNGVLSYDTLQQLLSILNQIPKDAFVKDKIVEKQSYHSLFVDQQSENTSVALVDGVNDLAVIFNYRDGKTTMLLTDEMEKVSQIDDSYLEPTQLWTVEDQELLIFMQELSEDPPVITYYVGAEYDWQDALQFTDEHFSLDLYLIEGWEHEYVRNQTNSGIRCRPDGVTEGWIYFSFWPNGYEPVEEDRYYFDGFYNDRLHRVSYPASVSNETGIDTRNAIWSYQYDDLVDGDYAVINDGADSWFLEYQDQIGDIITLSSFTVE